MQWCLGRSFRTVEDLLQCINMFDMRFSGRYARIADMTYETGGDQILVETVVYLQRRTVMQILEIQVLSPPS